MTSTSSDPSSSTPSIDSTLALRIELLRADMSVETDPARKARLVHAVGRLLDAVERNDVAAANEYLAAFQTNRSHRVALTDLIGIYERRKSATNLVKLYQVETKSAADAAERASALLDLVSVREDLVADEAGANGALAEAYGVAPEHPDVALVAELHARRTKNAADLADKLASELATADDPLYRAELAIDRAELLAADGRANEALIELRERNETGAAAARIALAIERIGRRTGDAEARAHGFELLGKLAASAIDDSASLEEPGIGALLWADALAARAFAVAAFRAAAAVRAGLDESEGSVLELLDSALAADPSSLIARFERLPWARKLSREDLVAEDENYLANALSESTLGAFAWNRIAAREEREGNVDKANQARARARALAPESAVLAAAEESGLRVREHAAAWRTSLGTEGSASAEKLATAAFIADELEDDYGAAKALYERAIAASPSPLPLLRALYSSALVHGDIETASEALAKMKGLDAASDRRRRVERAFLAGLTPTSAEQTGRLASSLLDADESADAAQLARTLSAEGNDFRLLERSHLRLAERGNDPEAHAAHRCAAARAALADRRPIDAEAHLRAALEQVHGHPVAIAVLDSLLRSRNDVAGLAELSRAASSGRAGEPAEVLDLARETIVRALARDPAAPGLAHELLEKSTSTTGSRTASLVANLIGDAELAKAARLAAADSETPLGRALNAYESAELELTESAPLSVDLRDSLRNEATSVDAAVLASLLPSSRRADLDPDILEALEAASFTDADAFLADPKGSTTAPSESWLRKALASDDPHRTMREELANHAGPATKLAAEVHRIANAAGASIDDIGIEVLRAAELEGGGELAAALADVAFGPDDDPQIRVAALEAAVRDAHSLDRAEYEARLARALIEVKRSRDAFRLLEAAMAASPTDLGGLEQLRMLARDVVELDRFVATCDALASKLEGESRAELLEDAATILAESLGRPEEARTRLLAAVEAAPKRERAYARAKALLGAMNDEATLAELASRRALATGDVGARARQLFESARHLRSANDRSASLAAIDELLAIDPGHAGALAMKAEIHVSFEQFQDAVEALRSLAKADVPPAQRRVALLGATDFLEKRLGRPDLAIEELRKIDALGLADAAILQRLARLNELEDAGHDTISLHERVLEMGATPLRLALSERERARLLLRDRNDAKGAAVGLARALCHAPDDVDAASMLTRLVSTNEERVEIVKSLEAAVRTRLTPETLSPEILRRLLAVADLRGARDLTKLVLSTLTTLRIETEEERAREEENTAIIRRVRPPANPITEALDALRDTTLSGACPQIAAELYDTFTDLLDLNVGQLGAHRNEALPKTDPVRTELVDLALVFGVTEVEAYPSANLDSRRLVGLATDRGLSYVVPRSIAVPVVPALRFHAGRSAWGVRSRTLPLLQRSVDDASAMLLGALNACDVPIGDFGARTEVSDWSKALSRAIGRKTKRAVHELGMSFDDRGAAVTHFCRAARQSSLRAGLIVSSDLEAALSVVLGTSPTFRAVAATPEAADLVCFHLSSTSLLLRRELGLAS